MAPDSLRIYYGHIVLSSGKPMVIGYLISQISRGLVSGCAVDNDGTLSSVFRGRILASANMNLIVAMTPTYMQADRPTTKTP